MTDISKCPIRLSNITATDMATLFGLNPYESPSKLLDKKLNPVPIESIHLRRGKLREPSVLEAFNLDVNMRSVRHEGPAIKMEGHRIAATPDAYTSDGQGVIEAKSVMSHNFVKWYDNPPYYYIMQVFTQLMVTDLSVGYIGALEEADPKESLFRFIVWKVERNTEAEDLIKQEVDRFWTSVEKKKVYKVSSVHKKTMSGLIYKSMERVFPVEVPTLSTEIDSVLDLFK